MEIVYVLILILFLALLQFLSDRNCARRDSRKVTYNQRRTLLDKKYEPVIKVAYKNSMKSDLYANSVKEEK